MPEKTTKAQVIYGAMIDDIASGRLTPGEVLDEVQMARTYGVSRTPIREAIRRLEDTGLVSTRSHRGAIVAGLTERELDDMFAVMAELEAICAKWAALAMTEAERLELQLLHRGSALLVDSDDREAYAQANARFHGMIYDGAHNPYLKEVVCAANRRAAPFRFAQFEEPERLRKSHAEHGAIIQAIERRHAADAYSAMRAHIVVVRSAVDQVADRLG